MFLALTLADADDNDDAPNLRPLISDNFFDVGDIMASEGETYFVVVSWLAVAGASVTLFCIVGFLNAYGVFQAYYSVYLPAESASDISWIGSLSTFLLYLILPFGGILVDKIGPTIPLCVGSVSLVLAVFMTSLCSRSWELMLAQALLLGINK
ncbi:hypothetical protein DV737_g2899, partial [Chaetothyriales sp. CBS 132003]